MVNGEICRLGSGCAILGSAEGLAHQAEQRVGVASPPGDNPTRPNTVRLAS